MAFWSLTFELSGKFPRASLLDGSDRCIAECSQDGVDAGLIPRPLRLEPLKYILIDAKRDRRFGRQGMQTAANNASNDVIQIGFGMVRAGYAGIPRGSEACPVSAGLH